MIIEVYTSGFSVDNGKPTQKAGCAWMLKAFDNDKLVASRTITHPIGNCTQMQAQLNAARLALASIKKSERQGSFVRLYAPHYVSTVLEKQGDEYKASPKKNAEQVEQLRRWASYYINLDLMQCDKSDLEDCSLLAKSCAQHQSDSDTGTVFNSA